MAEIIVTGFVRDEGTVVVLRGLNEDGQEVTFAAEHRPAYDILHALAAGEEPVAEVPDYLILGVSH